MSDVTRIKMPPKTKRKLTGRAEKRDSVGGVIVRYEAVGMEVEVDVMVACNS